MPIEIESPEEMGYGNIQFNLAESSVKDININELEANLNGLVLNYGDHRGDQKLRKLICENSEKIQIENVLVCQAAAMALFIVNTSLLTVADHLIVIRPNYATNIETPKAINCEISYVDLQFENGFQPNIAQIERKIQPNTKLISITTPHNPTGIVLNSTFINELINLAKAKNIYLLFDETYRELNFQSELKPYFAEKSSQVISICSLSKAYGLPGIRIGWIITQDKTLYYKFLAAKEQIIICNSVVDEYLAYSALKLRDKLLSKHHLTLKTNFSITKKWIENHPYLEWIEPEVGAVCFVKFKENLKINIDGFYTKLFEEFGTIVGPGHWFEETDKYFRLGFGYPLEFELTNGLKAIDACIQLNSKDLQ